MAAFLVIVLLFFGRECSAATFTLTNNCAFTVWPGALSNAGEAALSTTGFTVQPGNSKSLHAPVGWSGRFWGRTLCSADSAGLFSCGTGDCGSGEIECGGGGAAPPVTLAEFTLGSSDGGGTDYYDVSLVDGYNLPMLVAPQGGSGGGCQATGCAADVNGVCPADLKVVARAGEGEGVGLACRSACEAFGSPEYCCSGQYGNPGTCKPSAYSRLFKSACPRAYSYAFDDATSTFTCAAAEEYFITFCPATTATSQKSSDHNPAANGEATIIYLGGGSSFGRAAPARMAQPVAFAAASIAIIAASSSWLL